jgi:hypothetical protein
MHSPFVSFLFFLSELELLPHQPLGDVAHDAALLLLLPLLVVEYHLPNLAFPSSYFRPSGVRALPLAAGRNRWPLF